MFFQARRFYCLLYTSDAADEEDSVDLGGRRIIKMNNRIEVTIEDYLGLEWIVILSLMTCWTVLD